MRLHIGTGAVLWATLLASACGGANVGSPQSAAGSGGGATAGFTAVDQIRRISIDLQGQLDALMAPIEQAGAVASYVAEMPGRLDLDKESLLAAARSTLETGQVSLSAELASEAEVRAEVENAFQRLRWIVGGLQAMPANAQALGARAGEAIVKLPALAAKATTEANLKAANPFASAEAKAQAQADLRSLSQVQADAQKSIQQVQQQILGLPDLATKAFAKLTASFAGGGKKGAKAKH